MVYASVSKTDARKGLRVRIPPSASTSFRKTLAVQRAGAGEWAAVTASLGGRLRTLALEQRGRGRSERVPSDVSRAAYVDDIIAMVGSFCTDHPVCLVGQSLGGHTALLAASERPDLVGSLVVVEATAGGPDKAAVERVRGWLDSWPRPFASREEALEFFGGGQQGDSWVAGLEQRDDGLWPRFDDEVMLDSLAACEKRSWWVEWRLPTSLRRRRSATTPVDATSRMTHISASGIASWNPASASLDSSTQAITSRVAPLAR
jgi:pimeloyl-ACP methyl ester carboxylesterase